MKILLVLLACLSLASVASAQTYTPHRLPNGTRLAVAGQTYQGFNIGEYQELLRLDSDWYYLSILTVNQQNQIASLQTVIENQTSALEVSASEITLLQTERTRLLTEWQEADARLVAEMNKTNLFEIIGWSLAGGFALSTIILTLILALVN
jgi:hypothetical protein